MDELTLMIKKNIKQKYSSVRSFSEELGIPQTTIVSAIKNGISGTSFTTVCKICKALDIKLIDGIYPVVVSDNVRSLFNKLSKLDDKGIHTVATVLEVEYVRCNSKNISDELKIAEYNEKGYLLADEALPTKKELTDIDKVLKID